MILNKIRLEQEKVVDKKIRNKARGYSSVVFVLLLVAILLPFCNEKKEKDPLFEKAILIQFEEEDFKEMASAEKSSSRAADNAPAAKSEEKVEEDTPASTPEPVETEKPDPKPEKVTPPTTDPVPIKPSNDRPVLTAPEPAEINIEEMLQEIPEEAQVEEVSEEVTEVTEEVSADFMAELEEFFKESSGKADKPPSTPTNAGGSSTGGSGTANTDKPDNGTSSTPGDGDTGKADSGKSKTDGQGTGTAGSDFQGDGLLTRKVIKRASLDKIIKKNGKIVINLCVNKDGEVIFAKADKASSSIKTAILLKKAERAAKRYRYEKDYTAAERQCGKLTVIIKGLE